MTILLSCFFIYPALPLH